MHFHLHLHTTDTSEGAKRAWVTRRGGAAVKYERHPRQKAAEPSDKPRVRKPPLPATKHPSMMSEMFGYGEVHHWEEWGAACENSMLITGQSALLMGISGYRQDVKTPKWDGVKKTDMMTASKKLATDLLSVINQSRGIDQALYHGESGDRFASLKVGQSISLPLTASTTEKSFADNVSVRRTGGESGESVILKFSPGTPMVGYQSNRDMEEINFPKAKEGDWPEAIVAGKFKVSDIQRSGGKRIITLEPRQVFNPKKSNWDDV